MKTIKFLILIHIVILACFQAVGQSNISNQKNIFLVKFKDQKQVAKKRIRSNSVFGVQYLDSLNIFTIKGKLIDADTTQLVFANYRIQCKELNINDRKNDTVYVSINQVTGFSNKLGHMFVPMFLGSSLTVGGAYIVYNSFNEEKFFHMLFSLFWGVAGIVVGNTIMFFSLALAETYDKYPVDKGWRIVIK